MIRYYIDNPLPFYESYRVYDLWTGLILGHFIFDYKNLNAKEKAQNFCDTLNRLEGE
jgi:hypothetical protein